MSYEYCFIRLTFLEPKFILIPLLIFIFSNKIKDMFDVPGLTRGR